jgi:cytochrome c
MKRVLAVVLAGLGALAAQAGTAAAQDDAPAPEVLARGRELFNKKEGLGAKYACILCHQRDKTLERAKVEKLGDQLPAVINKYLVEKSKGKPLPPESDDMKALIAYIKHEHSK